MAPFKSRRRLLLPLCVVVVYLLYSSDWFEVDDAPPVPNFSFSLPTDFQPGVASDPEYYWNRVQVHHPLDSVRPLPKGRPKALPKVQATAFAKESREERQVRRERQAAVKQVFERSWSSYKDQAWGHDELVPIRGGSRDPFGGWAATLVDSLDTLLIMGMRDEYELAAAATVNISFVETHLQDVNIFETTIRYLGGFLSAYDLTGDQRMLLKAREVGDMLYVAFDTENRLPVTRWNFHGASKGLHQIGQDSAVLAEVASLSLEFTRLSLITRDPKWWDATERIREFLQNQQETTQLPGMWPLSVNTKKARFDQDHIFSLGAKGDSAFEYLPKMTALLGGLEPAYENMYTLAMNTAINHNLWRPMTPDEADILLSGTIYTKTINRKTTKKIDYQGQHLTCFAGGMFALGGKLTNNEDHLDIARRLTDGCTWVYRAMPSGVMPETFHMEPCPFLDEYAACPWDENIWKRGVLDAGGYESDVPQQADSVIGAKKLPPGFTLIPDATYALRPEAIESVFIQYRTTGDRRLLDDAWDMFLAIEKSTRTDIAYTSIKNVLGTTENMESLDPTDSMESFWLGETLKYFYLIFSEPNLISLDEFVFNTEAHPFRRLRP